MLETTWTSHGVPIVDALGALEPSGVLALAPERLDGHYQSVRWYVPGATRTMAAADVKGALVLGVGLDGSSEATIGVANDLASAGASGLIVENARSDLQSVAMPILTAPEGLDWAGVFASVDILLLDGPSVSEPSGRDDVTEFANSLAEACQGHVMVADRMRWIIGWSSAGELDAVRAESLITRRTPESMADDMHRDGSWQRIGSGDVTEYYGNEEDGRRLRLGVCVRVGTEVLGFLSVLPNSDADIDAVKEALRRGATAAVPCLVRHLARQAGALQRSNEVLPLLEGNDGAAHVVARTGLIRCNHFTVAAVAAGNDSDLSPTRILARLDLHVEVRHVVAATALVGNTIYLVVGSKGLGSHESATRILDELIRDLSKDGARVIGGIGGEVTRLSEVRWSREQADLVLSVLRSEPARGRVADLSSVRSAVVVEKLRRLTADLPWLFDGAVNALSRHDQANNSELLETFEAWLRHGRSGRAAAKALGLHPSSMHARLSRIWHVTGLSPDDYQGLLVADLEIAVAAAGAADAVGEAKSAGT